MGDATNTVMILAGEMLKKAEHLLIMGLHPSEIIKGYELASVKALAELDSKRLLQVSKDRHSNATVFVFCRAVYFVTTIPSHPGFSCYGVEARHRIKTIRLRGPTRRPRRRGLTGRHATESQKLQRG